MNDSAFNVLHALPLGVFAIDKQYRIIFWNSVLENWTGRAGESVLGRDAVEIFSGLGGKKYRLQIDRVFTGGFPVILSYQLHKKLFLFPLSDGGFRNIQCHIIGTGVPGNPEESCAVFSLQDITGLMNQVYRFREMKDQALSLVKQRDRAEEELRMVNEELTKLAGTDPLTGLSNRRAMMVRLEKEVARFRRHQTPFTLILADIDHFKTFNDRFGHDCGDFLLSSLGKLFLDALRPDDEVARWGGEEFLILLSGTHQGEGVRTAERLREHLVATLFPYEDVEHAITMTFGVSEYNGQERVEYVVKEADEALYEGKEQGRNRVVSFPVARD